MELFFRGVTKVNTHNFFEKSCNLFFTKKTYSCKN